MENWDNRRTDRRIRTLKGGRIAYNGGFTVAICTVKNLSEGGAQLDVDEVFGIPSEFVLYINPERDGRPCRVAWRAGTKLGVIFTGPPIMQQPAPVAKRALKRHDEGY